MEFINHTPFPALAFGGIDQHDQAFHVLVLRQTLSFETGTLLLADEQAPLCEVDEYFGEMHVTGVRQESDLCQYKPKCDVIVNATAYAPGGQATARIPVAVNIKDSKRRTLLEKHLTVTGPRHWEKKRTHWTLSEPQPITSLTLRDDVAYGGEFRVYADEPAAERIRPEHHLTAEQRAHHPDPANLPVVHTVFEANPLGLGYVEPWMIDALALKRVAAPQLESPSDPLTPFSTYYTPHRLGVRPKAHPDRRKLSGTISPAFIQGDAWLPEDFDFAVWNAAPPDQQIDFLRGDEVIELTNLCAPNAAGSVQDINGNTVLRLTLPGHRPFALIRFEEGMLLEHAAQLDTLIIDPDRQQITCVWRAIVGVEPEVRVLEARMLQKADIADLTPTPKEHVATRTAGTTHGG